MAPTRNVLIWYRQRLSQCNHPPASSAEVKERVDLYLHSPSVSSWPVVWRTEFRCKPTPVVGSGFHNGLFSRRTDVDIRAECVQCHCRGPALNLDSSIFISGGRVPKSRYSTGDTHTHTHTHTHAVHSLSSVSDVAGECYSVLARYGS